MSIYLGTWEGPGWTPSCTLSSVLLSIQSLLCANPIHNEPGWETVNTKDIRCTSYNDVLRLANIKIAILENIYNCQEEFTCFLPIMKSQLQKNREKIIDNLPLKDKGFIVTKTFNLLLKYDNDELKRKLTLDKKSVKKQLKRYAPNIASKDQEVGFRIISTNDDKEYEVYLTKTGKKRWRKFKVPE